MVKSTDGVRGLETTVPVLTPEISPDSLKSPGSSSSVKGQDFDSFQLEADRTLTGVKEKLPDLRANVDGNTGPTRLSSADPLLRGGAVVVVKPGERWADVLDRHYGVEVPLPLVERIAYAHESSNTSTPPEKIIAPSLEELFYDLHGGTGACGQKVLDRAQILIVPENKTLHAVVKEHYRQLGGLSEEDLDADFLTIASMAVEVLNGGNRYSTDPLVVALPSINDLARLVDRLRTDMNRLHVRREAWISEHQITESGLSSANGGETNALPRSAGTPRVTSESTKKSRGIFRAQKNVRVNLSGNGDAAVVEFASSTSQVLAPEISQIAAAGKYYQPEVGETMGDVAAYVYREHLTQAGLSPEQAQRELQEIMLAVVRWNKLKTLDIGAVPALYWPSVAQLSRFRNHPRVRLGTEQMKVAAPHLWQGIVSTSANAQSRALRAIDLVVELNSSVEDQLKAVDSASDTVFMMQLEQMWTDPDFWTMDNYGPVWVDEHDVGDEQEVYPGELAARKPNETYEAYAQRLFQGTLASYEIAQFSERPEFLVAVHLGIMNRNGDFEPGTRQALHQGLVSLGLMNEDGTIVIGDDASAASIDAKTVQVLSEDLGLDLEREPGEAIDAYLERANWRVFNPEQQDAIKQLWLWNVMAKSDIREIAAVEGHFGSTSSTDGVSLDFLYSDDDELDSYQAMLMLDESLWLDDNWEVEKEPALKEKPEDKEANARYRRVVLELTSTGTPLQLMSDEQRAEFRESFQKLLAYIDELDREAAEYHEKLVIAARICANKILNGEPVGGPMTWLS